MVQERALVVGKELPAHRRVLFRPAQHSRGHDDEEQTLQPLPPQERHAIPTVYGATAGNHAQQPHTLAELEELARAAGAVVVGRLVQWTASTDSRYLIGSGKARELRDRCQKEGVDLVIFNADLTPAQVRHLEALLRIKVIDRTQLILDIFAQRARSREGQIQVELAQLRYLLPRLTGEGTLMSRLGGGIGTRGPGETKLEVDRRRLRQRIKSLEQSIKTVARTRALQRRHRRHGAVPLVALVGYTNAGKSTLFNALTGAGVSVAGRLFATLDPTIRRIRLPHKTVIALSDTVGFLRNLPHSLIAAFMATLEEVREAEVIVHVIDRSHSEWREQAEAVERVLAEIGADATPRLAVYNKIDGVDVNATTVEVSSDEQSKGQQRRPVVAVSALMRTGLDRLVQVLESIVCSGIATYEFSLPTTRTDIVALLYEHGRVTRRVDKDQMIMVEVELTGVAMSRFGHDVAPFMLPSGRAGDRRVSMSARS